LGAGGEGVNPKGVAVEQIGREVNSECNDEVMRRAN